MQEHIFYFTAKGNTGWLLNITFISRNTETHTQFVHLTATNIWVGIEGQGIVTSSCNLL